MESEGEGDALTRLEAALDRIARRAQGALPLAPSPSMPSPSMPSPSTEDVASRLDLLIGQIRGALDDGATVTED